MTRAGGPQPSLERQRPENKKEDSAPPHSSRALIVARGRSAPLRAAGNGAGAACPTRGARSGSMGRVMGAPCRHSRSGRPPGDRSVSSRALPGLWAMYRALSANPTGVRGATPSVQVCLPPLGGKTAVEQHM
jgi:hypothetical protein